LLSEPKVAPEGWYQLVALEEQLPAELALPNLPVAMAGG
jgi:hypothetical protein